MLLLSNLNETLEMINKGLRVNGVRLMELGELINRSWDKFLGDEKMITIMNNFMNNIKQAYATNNKKWIYKTCRMSVNDIIQE